jgi:hypothetical protein
MGISHDTHKQLEHEEGIETVSDLWDFDKNSGTGVSKTGYKEIMDDNVFRAFAARSLAVLLKEH